MNDREDMTIQEARCKFENLKTAILSDGKIDWTETEVLLDFIDWYVKSDNAKFVEFKKLLLKCREDGKIDEEESKLLASRLDSISSFLKIEFWVERLFFGAIGIGLLCLVAYMLFVK